MTRQLLNIVFALLLVALLGWVDYLTGTDVRAVLFYLVPIVFVAWRNGYRSLALVTLASSLAWALAEFHLKSYDNIVVAVWNELTALVVFSLVGFSIIQLRRDRDQLRLASQRIQDLLEHEEKAARTDALTGLPNSREFTERLTPEIARCLRDGNPLCLLYLDLDDFKGINDHYGHAVGDRVLQQVAQNLRGTLRAADIPARLGGDEFAALLWQTSLEDARLVGDRIVQGIAQVGAAYPLCSLGASVGVVWYQQPPATADEVIRVADQAMYSAKKSGKRRTVVLAAADTRADEAVKP